MDDTSEAKGPVETLNPVVRKLAIIWVWSVLCVSGAELLYRCGSGLLLLPGGVRFGTGSVVDALQAIAFVVSVLVLLAMLVSMCYLYQFLSRCLLPLLFPDVSPGSADAGPRSLRRAFAAFLCALAVEVAGCAAGVLVRLFFGVR